MKLGLRLSKALLFLLGHVLLAPLKARLAFWGDRTDSLLPTGILGAHPNTIHYHTY